MQYNMIYDRGASFSSWNFRRSFSSRLTTPHKDKNDTTTNNNNNNNKTPPDWFSQALAWEVAVVVVVVVVVVVALLVLLLLVVVSYYLYDQYDQQYYLYQYRAWEVLKGPPLRVNFENEFDCFPKNCDTNQTRQGCATRLWNPQKHPLQMGPLPWTLNFLSEY